uniref:AIG1-type G domain-containing protein n=1 Tax=Rhizophagus irregularis (strain DAOM 181602 / DAOM 197198 / MUCL 43194) TaxID=747089 RepID=U9T9R0_RHIID
MNVQNEVVLLLGKTGKAFISYRAGKSTLGNQLLGNRDNKPFTASSSFKSKTSKCEVATLKINNKNYDLVDTPGLFDSRGNVDPLKEITEFVNQCDAKHQELLEELEYERKRNLYKDSKLLEELEYERKRNLYHTNKDLNSRGFRKLSIEEKAIFGAKAGRALEPDNKVLASITGITGALFGLSKGISDELDDMMVQL